MPELPEVEYFRQLLAPLCDCSSRGGVLRVRCPSPTPPKKFPTAEEWESLCRQGHLQQVLRKGKVLCLVFAKTGGDGGSAVAFKHLYLHMGMTGRISSPKRPILQLESSRKTTTKEDDGDDGEQSFPPTHTHVTLQCGSYQVAFSDPRRFGSVLLVDAPDQETWTSLAPDALDPHDGDTEFLSRLCGQKKRHGRPIKSRLLDQRDIVSGVGNWVADEVLYHARIHPMQTYLTPDEGLRIRSSLSHILRVAICCLARNSDYPEEDWIFPHRWGRSKEKKGSKSEEGHADKAIIRDSQGRAISFEKMAGRTTLYVPSIQTLYVRTASSNGESPNSSDATVKRPTDTHTIVPRRTGWKTSTSNSGTKSGSISFTHHDLPRMELDDSDDSDRPIRPKKRRQK